MASPEAADKAKAHLDRINAEIAEFEQLKPLAGSIGAKYLEHLRAHRVLWETFLDE